MIKKLLSLFCSILLTILLLSKNLPAMMQKVDLSYLANNAQYICYGRVEGVESHWNEDATHIFTTVTLSIFESAREKS